MNYVIIGATGHTGSQIAKSLLQAGKRVKIISRKTENLAELIALGGLSKFKKYPIY